MTPQTFGLPIIPTSAMAVDGPEASALRIREILAGKEDPGAGIVAANTAVALWTAGMATDWTEAITKVMAVLKSGKALETLNRWATVSQG